MGLPVEVNNLMLGSLGGYTISRSLRFRSSASAYLNRTPSSSANSGKFTVSFWTKLGSLSTQLTFLSAYNGTVSNTTDDAIYLSSNQLTIASKGGVIGASGWYRTCTQVLRDPSAWYHIVIAFDMSQSTNATKVVVYINGVQVTAYTDAGTFAAFNYLNTTNSQRIGQDNSGGGPYYSDMYMAEMYLIDGQQLTASSFGAYDTNGVWQPKKYTGTYGTNGFYLPFSNTTSTTTLVQDSSGNGNNWTPNNISLTAGTTYDSMIDSPTNAAGTSTGIGNYATFNPLVKFAPNNSSYSSGNLGMQQTGGASGAHACAISSIAVSSGKWYAEFSDDTATYDGNRFGIMNVNNLANYTNGNPYIGWASDGYVIYKTSTGGNKENNGVTTSTGVTWGAGAIISIAVDLDNSKIWWRVNGGTWIGGGDPAAGTSPTFSIASGNTYAFAVAPYNNNGVTANFGQRPFSYTPPSGFKALNTYNLPAPSIANGAQYMTAITYSGNSTNGRTVTTGFRPDFVWVKNRSSAFDNILGNSMILTGGEPTLLSSNLTLAEFANGYIGNTSQWTSTSFTVNGDSRTNATGSNYVAWAWLGGNTNGSGVTNTSGTITSTVSANTTAGFSVVTYTGNGTAGSTVGHGLGVAPNLVIWKKRSSTGNWFVWSKAADVAAGSTRWGYLNATNAFSTSASTNEYPTYKVDPTSTVLTLNGTGSSNGTNDSSATYVAYCFSAVSGYSAMGSWTGNGSSDGPFVFTNFRPRYVMWKRTDVSGDGWWIVDSSRNTYNVATQLLFAQSSTSETAITTPIDFLSNGFKLRNGADGSINGSGGTYIYMAFAENPFSIARAR